MKWYLILGLVLLLIVAGCKIIAPPEPVPVQFDEPAAPEKETRVKFLSTSPKVYHISSLGRKGFTPEAIITKPGDTVVWTNYDPEQKIMVIIFHNLGDRWKYVDSPAVKPGERYQYRFTDTGVYEFWSTEYGTKGKIEVKEI